MKGVPGKTWLFCLCAFCLFNAGLAQVIPAQKYSVQQGLSHSNVFRIFQDQKGFLWFCTAYGLNRFDGRTFRSFTSENGLSNNSVISVMQLPGGDIWINGFGKVNILHNDSIREPQIQGGSLPEKCVYSVCYDSAVWLIGQGRRYELFRIKDSRVERMEIKDSMGSAVEVTKVMPDSSKGLVFCTSRGLYTYRRGQGFKPFLASLIRENVFDVEKDRNGHWWIGLEKRIVEVSGDSIAFTYNLRQTQAVSRILADSENNIWAALPKLGIIVIRNHQVRDITDNLGIGKIIINDLYEDREKNIWVATHGDGIYRIAPMDAMRFPVEKNKLNVYAKAITRNGRALFIGTFGTISRVENDRIVSLASNNLHSIDCIYFIKAHGKGKLLIGLPWGLLLRDTAPDGQEKAIEGYGAVSACTDKAGVTWVGSFSRLYTFNGKGLVRLPAFNKDRRVNSIFEDTEQQLWLGTDSGVYVLNRPRSACRYFTMPLAGRVYVNQVYQDRGGRLWFATDRGLFCRDSKGWHLLTRAEGMAHSKCNCLCEDSAGNMWAGTLKGLNKIDPRSFGIAEVDADVVPNEVLSITEDGQGRLFVGTVSGVSIIGPGYRQSSAGPPPLYITLASVGQLRVYDPEKITLPYGSSKLRIEFAGLSFRHPGGIEYRYCLAGTGQGWNTTTNNSIEIPVLYDGSYDFELQARVNRGAWGAPVKLLIHVPPPFWKTGWFIAPAILVPVLLLYLGFRWWFRRQAHKQRKEQLIHTQVNHLRQQALQALINPHFIFNCMNSIQFYLHQNNAAMANKYLARFGQLIRMTMEQAQETFIPMADELSRLELYLGLEKLRCGENLGYSISVDPALDVNQLRVPNMILQPYVENAVWHGIMPKGEPGRLEVLIGPMDEDHLHILIRDDGVGLGKAGSKPDHTSYGMQLTETRLRLMQQLSGATHKVTIAPRHDSPGTQVSLILPKTGFAVTAAG